MRDVGEEGCDFPLGGASGPEKWIRAGSLEKCCTGIESSARAATASLISDTAEERIRDNVGEFVAVATPEL